MTGEDKNPITVLLLPLEYYIYLHKKNRHFIQTLLLFTDINECSSTPCLNAGQCIDGINAYTCQCEDGYSGEICETSNLLYFTIKIII